MASLELLFMDDARNFYCRTENNQNHRQQLITTVPIRRKLNICRWTDPETGEKHRFVDNERVHYRIKCDNGKTLKFTFNQLKMTFEGLSKNPKSYAILRRIQLEHGVALEDMFAGNPRGIYGNKLRRVRNWLKIKDYVSTLKKTASFMTRM
jgi:hypothetical protein